MRLLTIKIALLTVFMSGLGYAQSPTRSKAQSLGVDTLYSNRPGSIYVNDTLNVVGYGQINNIEARSGDMVAIRDTLRTNGTMAIGSLTSTIDSALTIFSGADYGGIHARGGLFSGSVSILRNLYLPEVSSSVGVIYINSQRVLNGFDPVGSASNIFIGYGGGNFTMTGLENTGVGAGGVLSSLTSGTSNVVIGYTAGENITSGTRNTLIGAGINDIVGGIQNIMIGYLAGSASGDVSDKLFIEPTASTTPLIGGDFAADSVDINGTLNVTENLNITGAFDGTTGDFSSTLTLSGTAANIALGSNFISNGGTDAGISLSATNDVTTSAELIVSGTDTSYIGGILKTRGSVGSSGGILIGATATTNRIQPGLGQNNLVVNGGTAGKLYLNFDTERMVMVGSLDNSTTMFGVEASNAVGYIFRGFRSASGTSVADIDTSGNLSVTGAIDGTSADFSSTLTLSGTAANIALGSNFISNGGTDAGLSLNASNNATLSGTLGSGAITSTGEIRSTLAGTAFRALASSSGGGINAIIDNTAAKAVGNISRYILRLSDNTAPDFEISHYQLSTSANDSHLRIGPNTNTDAFIFTRAGDLSMEGNLSVTGTVAPGGNAIQGALGVPAVNDTVAWTAQTASISAQNFANTTTGKLFEVSYYAQTTTTGTGTVTVNFGWNDGNAKTFTSATAALTATDNTGYVSGTEVIYVASGTPTWSTTVAGGGSTEVYAVRVVLKRLW